MVRVAIIIPLLVKWNSKLPNEKTNHHPLQQIKSNSSNKQFGYNSKSNCNANDDFKSQHTAAGGADGGGRVFFEGGERLADGGNGLASSAN